MIFIGMLNIGFLVKSLFYVGVSGDDFIIMCAVYGTYVFALIALLSVKLIMSIKTEKNARRFFVFPSHTRRYLMLNGIAVSLPMIAFYLYLLVYFGHLADTIIFACCQMTLFRTILSIGKKRFSFDGLLFSYDGVNYLIEKGQSKSLEFIPEKKSLERNKNRDSKSISRTQYLGFALAVLLCLIFGLAFVAVTPSSAIDRNYVMFGTRNVIYSFDPQSGTYQVDRIMPSLGDYAGKSNYGAPIVIPEQVMGSTIINGKSSYVKGNVTKIASDAFNGIRKVDTLALPHTIENIESGAFKNSSITSLIIKGNKINFNSSLTDCSINTITFNSADCVTDLGANNIPTGLSIVTDRAYIETYRKRYEKICGNFKPELKANEVYLSFDDVDYPTLIAEKGSDGTARFENIPMIKRVETSSGIDDMLMLFSDSAYTKTIPTDFSVTENVGLYVKRSRIYTITYEADGGTALGEEYKTEYYDGFGDITLPRLGKSGYTFIDWLASKDAFDRLCNDETAVVSNTDYRTQIDDTTGHNLILYAHFAKNYSINYKMNYSPFDVECSFSPTQTITAFYHARASFQLTEPSLCPDGYVFDGWYSDYSGSSVSSISTANTGDKTFYAKLKTIPYAIEYVDTLDVATDNVTSYDIRTAVTLTDLDKSGYTFDGWYYDSALQQKVNGEAIGIGNIGLRSFYAGWTLNAPTGTAVNLSFVYDKTKHLISPQLEHEASGVSFEKTWYKGTEKIGDSLSVCDVVESGSYRVEAIATDGRYRSALLIVENNEITISPITLEIDWESTDFTYNGRGQCPTASAVNVLEGDACSLTITGAQSNAGENYVATIDEIGNNNYVLGENTQIAFSIEKAQYNMSNVSLISKQYEYDGRAHGITISGELPIGLDNIAITVEYTGTATEVSDGIVTVTATFNTQSTNYYVPSPLSTGVSIFARTIEIIWAEDSYTYNGTNQATDVYAKYIDVTEREIALAVSFDYAFMNFRADGYVATAAFVHGETNYALPTDFTNEYTIKKAEYDMTAIAFSEKSFVYDGNSHCPTISGALPIGADGIQVTVSYEGSAVYVSEGAVSVSAVFATESENYSVPAKKSASVTISPLEEYDELRMV